jgi:hypothetical protein
MKLEREIKRLTGEVETWRKRAQAEGSLFDLKRDTVKEIAAAIAGNVSLSRLISIQKAITDEIARLRPRVSRRGERACRYAIVRVQWRQLIRLSPQAASGLAP